MVTPLAHPPETLEGWYALHQIYTCSIRSAVPDDTELRRETRDPRRSTEDPAGGWSIEVRLIGSVADIMVIHFRKDLDAIRAAQDAFEPVARERDLMLEYSFLSVTEAGLYHLTAKLAQEATARGGSVGDERYKAEMAS